jgi:hypothetical protein
MRIETGAGPSGLQIGCDDNATASIYDALVRKFHIRSCSEATLAPLS